jgi:hypothetical protein
MKAGVGGGKDVDPVNSGCRFGLPANRLRYPTISGSPAGACFNGRHDQGANSGLYGPSRSEGRRRPDRGLELCFGERLERHDSYGQRLRHLTSHVFRKSGVWQLVGQRGRYRRLDEALLHRERCDVRGNRRRRKLPGTNWRPVDLR